MMWHASWHARWHATWHDMLGGMWSPRFTALPSFYQQKRQHQIMTFFLVVLSMLRVWSFACPDSTMHLLIPWHNSYKCFMYLQNTARDARIALKAHCLVSHMTLVMTFVHIDNSLCSHIFISRLVHFCTYLHANCELHTTWNVDIILSKTCIIKILYGP